MAQIFLSYRRSESKYATGRISDRLRQKLGDKAVFQDVETISLGEDFEIRVRNILESCDVMLVVIGAQWLSVTEEDGTRRIDNPDDLVRREVVAALGNKKTIVIPVLIDDAVMPKPEQLPDELKPLATRNAATLDADASFDSQMGKLIEVILKQAPELSSTIRYGKIIGSLLGVVVLAVIGVLAFLATRPPEDLYEIVWNGVAKFVHEVEYGETRYQGLFLRTEGGAETLEGEELRKYDLKIDVTGETGQIADTVLTATPVFWDELPEGHRGRETPTIYLALKGGNQRGKALIKVTYENPNSEKPVSSSERVIDVFPPNNLAEAAMEAIDDLEAQLADDAITDQGILDQAKSLMQDRGGNGVASALRDRDRSKLETLVEDAQAAVDAFGNARNADIEGFASLKEREQAWFDYKNAAARLGRIESAELALASEALEGIEKFRRETMDILEADTCATVQDRECIAPTTCFDPGDRFNSWAKLAVGVDDAEVTHEIIVYNLRPPSVLSSGKSSVERSTGYRTWAQLQAPTPTTSGRYLLRVRHGEVILANKMICVGDCGPCEEAQRH